MTRPASRSLHDQFAAGTVDKNYLAIVRGVIRDERFVIDAPLGRDRRSEIAIRRTVVASAAPDAVPALTECRVLTRGAGHTLVELRPRTGRTHQLRAHLASIGHAVVGDSLYGRTDEEYLAWLRHVKAGGDPAFGREATPRHLLHAASIAVDHPRTGARLEFHAPLPPDMAGYRDDG